MIVGSGARSSPTAATLLGIAFLFSYRYRTQIPGRFGVDRAEVSEADILHGAALEAARTV